MRQEVMHMSKTPDMLSAIEPWDLIAAGGLPTFFLFSAIAAVLVA
jgi:hypothetical protein